MSTPTPFEDVWKILQETSRLLKEQSQETDRRAQETERHHQCLFVLGQRGETMQILNDAPFQPRTW